MKAIYPTSVLMCPPDYFDIEYEINIHMHKEVQVNPKKAMEQWLALKKIYEDLGIFVETLEAVKHLPDMVFTANAGFLFDKTVLLSSFKHIKERQKEVPHFEKKFQRLGFKTKQMKRYLPNGDYFEGHGDALRWGNTTVFGYGSHRSTLTGVTIASGIAGVEERSVFLQLVDPRFYHLDTCFCPIGEFALYYPGAFGINSRDTLERAWNTVEISEEDAVNFVCNGVPIQMDDDSWKFIVSKPTADLREILEKKGIEIIEHDASEFKKSGGNQRCLTIFL
ncbi:amidinotransferase [Candidatus Giovannonibacteria bacterium]|nr:amidinotransferase [Candidatus Giovannonibacteria bacterium]